MSTPGAPIIDLTSERLARSPHVVGNGRCVGCGCEGIHVVPASFFDAHRTGQGLECGRCGRMLVTLLPIDAE